MTINQPDDWPDGRFSFTDRIARRKLGRLFDEWRVLALERLGPDATLLELGVTTIVIGRDNKADKQWSDPKLMVVVTDAEEREERLRYERETGRCANCYGSGRQWAGWHYQEGTKYRPCCACGATGCARNEEAA